jgi:glycosyltransferase involved in cell wall biosynthesis
VTLRDPAGRVALTVVTPWFPSPEAPWSGTFIGAQVAALRQFPVDVRVLRLRTRRGVSDLTELDADGRPLPGKRRRGMGARWAAGAFAELAADGTAPDVILAEGVGTITLLRRVSPPVVGVLHGPNPLTQAGARPDPLHRRVVAGALARTAALVAVGVPVLFDLPTALRDRTTVVPNGVDTDFFTRRTLDPGTRVEAPDFPRLISVGNVDGNKNQALVARSLDRLRRRWPGLSWTVVGDGPGRAGLAELVERLGHADVVRLTGRLAPTDVLAELAAADLFVLPSRRDAFGCAYLEAMAVGVPTLVPRSAGASLAVRDPRHLHDPTDPAELLDKAAGLLGSAGSYADAVAVGWATTETLSWEAHGQQLWHVLDSVIRGVGCRERRMA